MKTINFKDFRILVVMLLGIMLAGCQQSPAPVVNTPPAGSSTTEHSTTTNTETKQVETPAPTPNPESVQTQTKTSQQTTTVEKKKD